MKRIAILCSALFIVQSALPWGPLGHAIVADIAESRLTPAAAKQVHELLVVEHVEHLHDISSWADQIRKPGELVDPAHSQRQPLDHSTTVVMDACPSKHCAVAGMHEAYDTLADKNAPLEKREIALKYLVHLVGDIHQPFHGAEDTGTEKVIFNGKHTKLHPVWDGLILTTRGKDRETFAKQFEEDAKKHPPVTGGTPEMWTLESRDLVRDTILPALPAPGENKVYTLPDDYAEKNFPLVQARITQAGYRLAELLNSALK